MEVIFLEQSHSTGNSNLRVSSISTHSSAITCTSHMTEVESNCLKLSFFILSRSQCFFLKKI
jgi:hypothetical protein